MIMGREQRPAADLVVHRLDHRPGDREPVIGRGAAADLVEDDEALGVACARIAAVSTISTMKVERPRARLSEAPTRLNNLSTMPTFARAAGTKLPAWASTATSADWRRKVDLPPMLGPVISHSRSSSPSLKSLATKRSPVEPSAASTTGWRPASTWRHGCSTMRGLSQPPSAARLAWLAATSMRATASAVPRMREEAAKAGSRELLSAPPRRRARALRPRRRGSLPRGARAN